LQNPNLLGIISVWNSVKDSLTQVINAEGEDILTYLHFKGGDKLKFGDIVIAVASIAVIDALIAFPLGLVFVSALGLELLELGQDVGCFVSLFLSALIGGYIFAGKIWEARREAITKITVLLATFMGAMAMVIPAGVAHWGLMAEEDFQLMYPGAAEPSTAEWVSWEMMSNALFTFIVVGGALLLGFIGLYVGSMLRKPKKS